MQDFLEDKFEELWKYWIYVWWNSWIKLAKIKKNIFIKSKLWYFLKER